MKLWEYAIQFIGLPYRWGGDDTIEGMDCSGFVQEVLASQRLDPPGDQTAQGLYDWLSKDSKFRSQLGEDAILFFGATKSRISHVAIAIDDKQMVEAGGGDSRTVGAKEAAEQNAFVRVRPIRKDLVAVLKYVP